MKKNITVLMFAAMALMFASCCKENPTLSASKAKSLFKKEMARMHFDEGYATLQVGYYECNDHDTRYVLRQLAANEVITYQCERVKKPARVKKSRRVQRGYYYTYYETEYYWVSDTIDTYFVTVALTEKGKALQVAELPKPEPSRDEKDLDVALKIDSTQLPELNVKYVEFPDEELAIANEEAGAPEDVPEEYDMSSATPGESTAYDRAKAKESIEEVYVKSHEIKIVKARNIAVDNSDVPSATAEIVYEYKNVTPFGRIMNKFVEGSRHLAEGVVYQYYQDKKWVVKKID